MHRDVKPENILLRERDLLPKVGGTQVCMCVCIYIYIDIYVYVYVCMCVCTYIYIYRYIYLSLSLSLSIYIYIYMLYKHTYKHTWIDGYTHGSQFLQRGALPRGEFSFLRDFACLLYKLTLSWFAHLCMSLHVLAQFLLSSYLFAAVENHGLKAPFVKTPLVGIQNIINQSVRQANTIFILSQLKHFHVMVKRN